VSTSPRTGPQESGHGLPFDPSPEQTHQLLARAEDLVTGQLEGLATRAVHEHADPAALVAELLEDRPGAAVDADEALATLTEIVRHGVESTSGGELAYIPGSGLVTSALGDLLASTLNRYTGLPGIAPAAVALEEGVLRWLCELFELPEGSQGVLLSGGSMANLSALLAARERIERLDLATIYVGAHAHASVRKAARIAGLRPGQVRVCPSDDGLRVDVEAMRLAIKDDLEDGYEPMAIVAAAGTTNAGAIDPLEALADLAAETSTWLHVDAAYGGFFQLTERGRARLAGIERADSITLDPHKSLFLPFGTGALLVRDQRDLERAFAEEADYLRDLDGAEGLPDFSRLTPELTRAWRGLRLWLPLKLHGLDAFRAALDEKLDLAEHVHARLDADPRTRTWGAPDLSVVPFRAHGDDATQDELLAAVHADGSVRLSSTRIDGEVALRVAILSHRTSRATVDGALDLIDGALAALDAHPCRPVSR
jgi:aromatic-L-amino-acid/L-tryptophan decarboxylase